MADAKIKKQWLISFFILVGYGISGQIYSLLFEKDEHQIAAVGTLIAIMIWGCATYFFAYHKKGTKWLLYVMIMMPINLLRSLVNEKWDYLPTGAIEMTIFCLVLCMHLAVFVWFWINCFRYRNRNIQNKLVACQTSV